MTKTADKPTADTRKIAAELVKVTRSAGKAPAKAKVTTAFTVDRRTFYEAAGRVARYVPEKAPVPVLQGILLEVDALGVTLTATDYEDVARLFFAADVDLPGRFLIPGPLLARILYRLPDGEGDVRVECNDRDVTVAVGKAKFRSRVKFTLLTMPTEDFPDMDAVIEHWRDLDARDGDPDAPTCRVADMDGVKPAGGDPQGLYYKRGLATMKLWKSPRPTKKAPYSPTGLQVGTEITWTRTTNTRQELTDGTTRDVGASVYEKVTGQVWCTDGTRSVWAVVEGEDTPSHVTEWKRWGRQDDGASRSHTNLEQQVLVILDAEGNPKPTPTDIRRRVVAEGSIVVEAEDLQPGDMVVKQHLRDARVPLHEMGTDQSSGAVVKSVGRKQERTAYDGRKTHETPVRLRNGKTMTVPDFYAVRVIRPVSA
jgi:hypothetical protein